MKYALISSVISLLFACGDSAKEIPEPVCGDGVVEGNEVCDDGNAIDTDSCSNACKEPGCGDGVVNFDEACDDGNDVDGDGCDNNCTQTFCGNGIKTAGEECDDHNTISGDGCDANCTPTGCGNGAMSTGEICDDGNTVDGDGCDSNCTVTGCGNNVMDGGEQCDDGNTTSADGCSASCTDETLEVEPNEDGTPSQGGSGTQGNDFGTTAPDANGSITNSTTVVASITPAGDEDIFKLENTSTAPARVQLDTWNLASGYGVGISCGTSIDTGLHIRSATGVSLASSDDKNGNCAGLQISLFPGDVVYAHVVEFGDNAVIASYALDIKFTFSVCGDGDVGPGEQCDDQNTAAGDGCSATCQIEGAVSELEPNDDGVTASGGSGVDGNDFATTHPLNNGLLTTDIAILGALSPAGDEDIYAFTNTRLVAVEVTFDTWGTIPNYGVGVPCNLATLDTGLVVRDAAGNNLRSNNDRNGTADRCSKLTFGLFPGETRFVQVTENGDNGVIASYALIAKYKNVICGDGTVGHGEQCDDTNTTPGDGCDATCQIEDFCGDGIMQPIEYCDDGNMMDDDGCSATCEVEGAVIEVEPNEDGVTAVNTGTSTTGNDYATANADANGAFTDSVRIVGRIVPAGDEDVFAFHNPGPAYVSARFDLYNNAPGFGIGVPCGTSIDTYLYIRETSATTSLGSSSDRNSTTDKCSGLTEPIAPGQTVYAHVLEHQDNGAIASYTLDVVFTPVPCGNGAMEMGEQCDDGNNADGDGCSSICKLENSANEVEPNEDGATATGAAGIAGNDFNSVAVTNANTNGAFTTSKRVIGAITPAGDEDVFAFTNPTAGAVLARFDLWSLATGKGIGVACGTSPDTGLNIRNAASAVLASNDDRNGSSDRCSGVTYLMSPGETVYAHVVENGDNSSITGNPVTASGYVLDVTYTPIVCGDGIVGPTEECDDTNTADGDGCSSTCTYELVCGNGVLQGTEECDDANTAANDGCSATCTVENVVAELEPNNTTADATASAVQIAGNTFVTGAIGAVADVDVYRVTLATATTVRFETFTSSGDCSTATLDLRLFDAAGASITSDLEGAGINDCGAITIFLDAGSYFVQVEERGNNATVAAYQLQVAFQASGGTETEPNETTAAATMTMNETYVFGDHMTVGDVDVYAITVPGGASIRAEIIEGDRMTETCEGSGIDSRLTLFDSAGTQIANDSDAGRGLCSLIDGTGTTPVDAAARNPGLTPRIFYLMVRASTFATTSAAQFVYRLQVTVR